MFCCRKLLTLSSVSQSTRHFAQHLASNKNPVGLFSFCVRNMNTTDYELNKREFLYRNSKIAKDFLKFLFHKNVYNSYSQSDTLDLRFPCGVYNTITKQMKAVLEFLHVTLETTGRLILLFLFHYQENQSKRT